MRTKISEMFNIEAPIFAFTHCRDVVVEASKAGGFGVLGAETFNPKQLEIELSWIDEHIGGRPYGVDVLMPRRFQKVERSAKPDIDQVFPKSTREWLEDLLRKHNVPPIPQEQSETLVRKSAARASQPPPDHAESLLEVAFRHPIKLMVSALGPPPPHILERAHGMGIKVGALVGKVEHAIKQRDAGVDFVVATGTEAGGHTGYISTMVLVPQIVDAVAPLPVLAAGGIGRGRQIAAALALGAEGVWCGSVWLTTRQSDLTPEMKERLLAAESTDAILTKAYTGKNCRILRSEWTDAWDQPGAPKPLGFPLQPYLINESMKRIERYKAKELMTYPAGQIIGQLHEEQTVRQVFYDMLAELADAAERLNGVIGETSKNPGA
jgi:NAD(P)H-dependent flavin oxidoreductase YrpB (nitropropane dioxygenase family)